MKESNNVNSIVIGMLNNKILSFVIHGVRHCRKNTKFVLAGYVFFSAVIATFIARMNHQKII